MFCFQREILLFDRDFFLDDLRDNLFNLFLFYLYLLLLFLFLFLLAHWLVLTFTFADDQSCSSRRFMQNFLLLLE